MIKGLVSIVMPMKNVAPFVGSTIESIQGQKYQEWELIVIDDLSTDQSHNIVRSFDDDRIQLICNEGQGIIQALQTGFKLAKGEYVTRMDADDIMPFTRLTLMVDCLMRNNQDTIATGAVSYFSQHPISEGYQTYENWINEVNSKGTQWKQIYRECVIASPNWMMYSSKLRELCGFDDLTYPEDYDLVFRWYEAGLNVQFVPTITLEWREHPGRTSRNSPNYNQKAFFKLKIKKFLELEDRGGSLVVWGTNPKGRLTSDILDKQKREFIWMDISHTNKTINGHDILPYHEVKSLSSPQVLIAVYPDANQRRTLENYLQEQSLEEGRDFWYL